jgi:CRISPR-associated endonuclease Cas1
VSLDLLLLYCEFESTETIKNPLFYPCPYWSGMFRNLYKSLYSECMPSLISIVPLDTGLYRIEPGTRLMLNIHLPYFLWHEMKELLLRFNELTIPKGLLAPLKSLYLKRVICRISGHNILHKEPSTLNEANIEEEMKALLPSKTVTLEFYTPFRIQRPAGTKLSHHRYIDGDFLKSYSPQEFLYQFVNAIRFKDTTSLKISYEAEIEDANLFWLDIPYSDKTLGGVIGRIILKNLSPEIKRLLIIGKYFGVGRKRAFGFGYYQIGEISSASSIIQPFRLSTPEIIIPSYQLKSVTFLKEGIHMRGTPYLSNSQLKLIYEDKDNLTKTLFPIRGAFTEDRPINALSDLYTLAEVLIEKRPVFLTTLNQKIYVDGAFLIVEKEDSLKLKIPWNIISHLYLIGNVPVTTGIISRALTEKIPVTFMDSMGKTKGNLYPEDYNLSLYTELQQKRREDTEFCLLFAKEVISAKIHNSIVLLRRNSINNDELNRILEMIQEADSLPRLRALEGVGGRIYFREFSKLVKPFKFLSREYHPPEGPVNFMLSFCYSFLYNRIASILHTHGLNPRLGIYHTSRGRHASLASDLMEPLRHIADRVVLKTIHLKEITEKDFLPDSKIKRVEISRRVIRTLIHRMEEAFVKESSFYEGSDLYGYINRMITEFIDFLKGDSTFRALRIR